MRSACLVLFAAGAAGLCGGAAPAADEDLSSAEGRVTFNGKPIPEGTITFHLKDDQFVGAKLKDGMYRVDRVPVGEFTVTIESKKARLPVKYSREETSGLKLAVKKGKNTADIDLSD